MAIVLNYKNEIKKRISDLKKRVNNPITLKKLSNHLQMQYTYLSRILNSSHEHLREDTLFEALYYLEFPDIKISLLMNSRILEGSSCEIRRKHASQQISIIQNKEFADAEQRGKVENDLIAQANYMLDPYATIILTAFSISKYRKYPQDLAKFLGLKIEELATIIVKLEKAGLIERGENKFDIIHVKSPRLYFREDNQFMRLHQQQMKQLSMSFLEKTAEDRKKSFMVTFVADEESFHLIKKEFNSFIEKVEHISRNAKPKKTYQLSFDFFDWF